MSPVRRIAVGVAAVAVLLGGGLLASRIPVGASHAVSEPYAAHWVLRSSGLQRCAMLDARGTVTAEWRATLVGGTAWSAIRVRDPTVAAASGCDGSPTCAMRVRLHQGWSAADCGLRAEPVAEEGDDTAPSSPCARDRVAVFDTEEGPSTSSLTQFNSENPAIFADALVLPWQSVALRGDLTAEVRFQGSEDTTGRTVEVLLTR